MTHQDTDLTDEELQDIQKLYNTSNKKNAPANGDTLQVHVPIDFPYC